MNRTLEHILPKVQKPARYTGGEYNAVVKDRSRVDLRYALCFPDTYEIGMSNLGCRILYGVMNERPDIWCERCFALSLIHICIVGVGKILASPS